MPSGVRHRRMNVLLMSCVGVFLSLVISAASFGQWVDFDSARIHEDEFRWQVERLDPSPPQREAMEIAYARYAEEYDAARSMREALNEWIWTNGEGGDRWYGGQPREEFGNEVWRESRMNEQHWESAWREVEGRYFERLADIAVGREEALEAFKRKRLRFREFNDTSGYWDTGWEIDLIEITKRVSTTLPDSPEVAKVLQEYEFTLHRVLLDIDAHRRNREEKYRQITDEAIAIRAAGGDASAALAERRQWVVRGSEVSFALRVLQQETASRLVSAVANPPERAELEDAIHVELWPMFKPEHGIMPETAFEEALAQHGLSEVKRDQVLALREAYRERRRSEFAGVSALYLDRFSPALLNERVRLSDIGDHTGSTAVFQASQEQWEKFRVEWQTECERVIAELNAIMAAPASETVP